MRAFAISTTPIWQVASSAALFCLLLVAACSTSKEAVDGDADLDSETENDARCEENALGCSGAEKVIICTDGQWAQHHLCEDGKTCEKGRCIYIIEDGDPEPEEEESEKEPAPEIELEDTRAPEVESTQPLRDQTGVPTSIRYLTISFDEPLNGKNFLPGRDLKFSGGCHPVLITGVQLLDDNSLLRITIEDMQPGTTYVLSLAGDVLSDAAGNRIGAFSFRFTTAGEPPADQDCPDSDAEDDQPPFISSSTPVDGAQNVATGLREFPIVFSEAVDKSGYSLASALSLTDAEKSLSISGLWVSASDHILIVNLAQDAALAPATTYTLSFTPGPPDLKGNAAASLTLRFSTAAAPEDGDVEAEAVELRK